MEGELPWALAMKSQREAGHFIDITLNVGGRQLQAHRIVLVGFSPYLAGLLTSGLAESTAQNPELQLDDMDGRAVEAVVDCMYTGKLAVSLHTATGIIRAANILQVGAVEKVASAFFISKLEPSAAVDALGFAAEHKACGKHAAELHGRCVKYAIKHFEAVSRDVSFLGLPCDTVAQLIASDDLPVDEPHVVSSVRSWFQHDPQRRSGALKTLMPLVRWSQLPVGMQKVLHKEILVKQLISVDEESRELGIKLMLECSPRLCEEGCPRLKRRKRLTVPLTFSVFSAPRYQILEEGAVVKCTSPNHDRHPALCGGYVMNRGKYWAEMTIVKKCSQGGAAVIGVCKPTLAMDCHSVRSKDTCVIGCSTGTIWCGRTINKFGTLMAKEGDVFRLLLDCDAGTLAIKMNGVVVGMPVPTGLTGDLCWMVSAYDSGDTLRIAIVDEDDF